MSEKKDILALTSFRGVAAILVLTIHLLFLGDTRWIPFESVTQFFVKGYVWVDFFFLLSGFIVSYVYGDLFSRRLTLVSVKDYLILRLARIYPLHIFAIMILFILEVVKLIAVARGATPINAPFSGPMSLYALIQNVFLIQDWGILSFPTWNGISWSVSVEFAAYIFFPFGFFIYSRLPRFGKLAFVVVLTSPLLVVSYYHEWDLGVTYRYFLARGIAEFWIGVGLRTLFGARVGCNVWQNPAIAYGSIISIIVILDGKIPNILILLPFCFLILSAANGNKAIKAVFETQAMIWLGSISYSVYMSHEIIITLVGRTLSAMFGSNNYDRFALSSRVVISLGTIALVLCISHFLFNYVEWPARSAIRKYNIRIKKSDEK